MARSKARIELNHGNIDKWAVSPEIQAIVEAEAEKASRDLQASLNHVRNQQRENDRKNGRKRELSDLTTSVEANKVTGQKTKRAAADIVIEGLTVMDIVRQTVPRAVQEAIPEAKITGKSKGGK